ncbi:kinase-like domain-containing protein, partial [Mycena olivaceomarginata]
MPPHRVAIKIYCRMLSESQELEQARPYTKQPNLGVLYDPNVLPFLGVSLDLGLSPALIAPLCPSGPIMKYFKMSAQDPTERLQMTIGVTEGLEYLHSQGIIHGNLCTVLINQYHSPVISGYGIFNILGTSSSSAAVFSTPIRFTPSEYSRMRPGRLPFGKGPATFTHFQWSCSSISFTEVGPFGHISTPHVVTRRIWNFLGSLWHENAALRPAMPDVLAILTDIDITYWATDESMKAGRTTIMNGGCVNYEPGS